VENLDIKTFPDNLVEFKVHRIVNARLFWINKKILKGDTLLPEKENEFLEKYAFAIKTAEFNDGILFSETEEKYLAAERYGGIGVGTNGGGVRCGNDHSMQIKGIGKNLLGINTIDQWHSYGGLNLVDAMYETIYSILLNKIMPIGTPRIHGLIIASNNSALLPGIENIVEKRSYGALLIRELCVRPAHFLPSPDFNLRAVKDFSISSDYSRVRNSNQILLSQLKTKENFIENIGRIIANHANQFAFARISRIRHGSISASNICLNGQWLDLTNTSFTDGQGNYCSGQSFLEEPTYLLGVLEEFAHNFAKYNKIKLNFSVLENYFFKQFNAYLVKHSAYLLGIPFACVPGYETNANLTKISSLISSIISANTKLTFNRPSKLMSKDPVIELVASLYGSFHDICIEKKSEESSLTASFILLLNETYSNFDCKIRDSLIIMSAILSIRRLYAAEYFFIGRLEGSIYTSVRNRDEQKCISTLEESISVIDWAFNKEEDSIVNNHCIDITIFESTEISIHYNVKRSIFIMRNGSKKENHEAFDTILEFFKKDEAAATINSFNFMRYLEKLGSLITLLKKDLGNDAQ
jgi:hypothetical protein